MSSLADQKCAPCEGGTQPMAGRAVTERMQQLSEHWQSADDEKIVGTFKFKNYYETQAFVNAVAYIAHREDHHPDITFGYNSCRIELTTHAIGGLSDNDFISAAKIDRLVD
ncbi:4a-hydroxytetrahydrobiopterin dehydratase [Salinisphaera hydrothermalis]|uniref:Putative pterin-4-alpha-carbinolamine dehydratase n=1 Tax=Salinisphaera hydrothermalis (strain C41B8) TaxID=1304275 RepID=A0A084IHS2_SALHC|nr:4a-hydroxytetrahydrobiopterin dehydratase [Salinisphaera hydrothermalis]KEZ76256.1 pterin-4-alpha-carbinolamine dehydratase [Salinisphaera hydrothermalis C41B8]